MSAALLRAIVVRTRGSRGFCIAVVRTMAKCRLSTQNWKA